jgi:hypothetical protein
MGHGRGSLRQIDGVAGGERRRRGEEKGGRQEKGKEAEKGQARARGHEATIAAAGSEPKRKRWAAC